MKRYISIQHSNLKSTFNESDLPLSIGEKNSADIQALGCNGIAGHIGDSGGHLFFQPAASNAQIFHNSFIVSSSVWLKSGDVLQIGESSFNYTVTGDHYNFVHSNTEIPTSPLQPPVDENRIVPPSSPLLAESEMAWQSKKHTSKKRWIAGIAILTLLVATALFTLFAQPVSLTTSPAPEKLSIKGFPPVLSLGTRFLALQGDYVVQAKHRGYLPLSEEITVSRNGSNNFSFDLKKETGFLLIKTNPENGVKVSIDNIPAGATPLSKITIPAGNHTLRFEKDRFFAVEKIVDIIGMTKVQKEDIRLSPAWADYHIETVPQTSEIDLNDVNAGVTPLTLELMQGEHTITLKKSGFTTQNIIITSIAGKHEKIVVPLTPSVATVVITSTPTGATIMVDNEFQGLTPKTIHLSSEELHTINLHAIGYENIRKTYNFKPEENREVAFKLTPEYGVIFFKTEPAIATLFINGKKQQTSNGRLKLPAKPTKIRATLTGYNDYTEQITPDKSFSQQIAITLHPKNDIKSKTVSKITTTSKVGGKKLLLVHPETFTMGAPRREAGRRANEHELQVKLKRPFYVSSNLVSNKEYKSFAPKHSSGVFGKYSLDEGNHPVVNITWQEAALYCNWLSQKQSLPNFYSVNGDKISVTTPFNNGYRLITEAEWAFISRKHKRMKNDKFPWIGGYPPPMSSGNFADQSAKGMISLTISGYNDSFPTSSPIGSFPSNISGIFDIGGNVAEWCHDYYTAYINSKTVDPIGPKNGSLHVIRGSSWRDSTIAELRLSYRGYHNKAQNDVGFRIARYAQ